MEPYCKPIIVEFCGLPGSGKSTIAQAVYSALCESPDVYFYSEIIQKDEKKCLLNPHLFFLFVKLIIISLISFHRFDLKQIYGMIVIIYNYNNFVEKFNGTLIVEQGLVQKILSLGYLDKMNEETALKFLELVLKTHKYVVKCAQVDCDIAEVIYRLQNRGYKGSRLNDIEGDNLLLAMHIQQENLCVIKKMIAKHFSSIKYKNFNSLLSVWENVKQISNYIYD